MSRCICDTCFSHPGGEYDILEFDVHPAVAVIKPPVVGITIFELHQHRLALGRLQQRERELRSVRCRAGGARTWRQGMTKPVLRQIQFCQLSEQLVAGFSGLCQTREGYL